MVTLEIVRGFANGPGGITDPALLRLMVDGEPVHAGAWLDGAIGEHRHQQQKALREHFRATPDGLITTTRDFSHLSQHEMTDLLSHLTAALRAAVNNQKRVETANERLAKSLQIAVRA